MKRRVIFILIVLLVSFQLIFFFYRSREVSSSFGEMRVVAIPFYRGWMVVRREVASFFNYFSSKNQLIDEKSELQKEVGRLQNELSMIHEQVRELHMKIAASHIESKVPFAVIPTQIVGRDPYDWLGKIVIDKGKGNQVQTGLTLVTYDGLVGRVEEVYPNYSIVRLILSPDIATGAIIQRTRDIGVVEGDGKGLCVMKYVYRTSQVQPGDMVVTSGLGISTPRGIVIGRVLSVRDNEGTLFKDILIKPECDFSRFEQLFIIRGMQERDGHAN
ncbi:MAG: rod shape-determining protein MreC [Atribacterota bacterium]|nr:rod shape-determining protein MreC [Candidatus Atribacteria bacterium]